MGNNNSTDAIKSRVKINLISQKRRRIFRILLLLFFVGAGCDRPYDNVLVTMVIDGDSVRLESGESVQLIGVDCPEVMTGERLDLQAQKYNLSRSLIQAMGITAYDFTKNLVEGKRVRLEFDQMKKNEKGRLLAYMFRQDNTCVNKSILREGKCFFEPDRLNIQYNDSFQWLEKKAKEEQKGVFSLMNP